MNKTGAPASSSTGRKPGLPKFNFSFSMQTLNQALLAAILICAAVLVYEMRSGMGMLGQVVDLSAEGKSSGAIAQVALPTNKDIKYYLDKVNSRNIFRPYEVQVKVAAGKLDLAKRLSKFKLVGVAWLDLPETASIMIEDTEQKTTYFLKQGEQLEGVTLKTIYTDRAVFSYENEETIVKL